MTDSTFPAHVASTPVAPTPAPTTVAADHPGRWVGGVIGGAMSLAMALVALAVDQSPRNGLEPIWSIGFLGIPVGFVLGRAFLPTARSDGWGHAIAVGIGLGWLAPPLGAPLALTALFVDSSMCEPNRILAWFAFLLFAVAISFVAIVVTIPIGIVWALAVRALPARWLTAARVPSPIGRLGVRHLLFVVAIGVVATAAVGSLGGCPGAFS